MSHKELLESMAESMLKIAMQGLTEVSFKSRLTDRDALPNDPFQLLKLIAKNGNEVGKDTAVAFQITPDGKSCRLSVQFPHPDIDFEYTASISIGGSTEYPE